MVNNRKRRWTRVGNRIGVWMYSTLNGRLSSGSKDVHVLMITTPGRRTGIPRSTCVRYLETAHGLVVWGTGSGSKQDPDWFQNLRTVDVADVQVKANRFQARPREVVGSEREVLHRRGRSADSARIDRDDPSARCRGLGLAGCGGVRAESRRARQCGSRRSAL